MQGRRRRWGWAAALGAGLALRAVFVWVHPRFVGDTLVYGDLAQNLLKQHVYGLTEGGHVRQTLIRLPGYPLFLALCFLLFGVGNYLPVVWVQVGVDLLGCWLLGRVAARLFGERAGLFCVWIAALCPFTANYAAAALTETLSIFCVMLAFWALLEWCIAANAGQTGLRWAAVVGVAFTGAALLRPDGVLLAGAVLPAMGWMAWRGALSGSEHQVGFELTPLGARADGEGHLQAWKAQRVPCGEDEQERHRRWRNRGFGVIVALLLPAACLGVWAARNWRVFHVVQPLAPKYANDPGEPAPMGFARWYRTWGVGLGDTARVYWEYDGGELRLEDLPPWAFDGAAQRAKTARVYADYNAEMSSTPEVEAAFAQLAAERVRAHPVRFYVVMPLARLGDMWLRPRTELLPRMPLRWWKALGRPGAVLFAWAYGLLNATLLVCAGVGLARWWRRGWGNYGVIAGAMVGFALLRSGLLLTIDNSEPRYVLECYPVAILLAAVGVSGLGRRRKRDANFPM